MPRRETDPDLERRALALAEDALEVQAEERSGFLDATCAADDALRARVERLLELESEGDLDTPAGLPVVRDFTTGPIAEEELPAGTRIGSYELVRLIARGGMGRVYEARQEKPKRRVALKILRLGLEDESVRRRFLYESEVLAHLRHPGIAQVFEAGVFRFETPLGARELPYFALEYLPGARSLSEWARQAQPSLEEVLRMFASICDAVHHAHVKGIVHRDLKPANILVDGGGAPKVIDFGVARATSGELESSSVETRTGQLLGTVHYMSPEQLAEGPSETDARSDVYALGVVLYEVTCGRLPFESEGKSMHAIGRAIVEDAPLEPSRVRTGFPRDVEAILLRTLEKEPRRRYDSAAALGTDIRRFLANEPIEARPAGALYRLRLYTRRNRALVVGGIVGALSLVAAVGYGAFASEKVSAAEEERSAAVANEEAAVAQGDDLEQEIIELSSGLILDALNDLGRMSGSEETRLALVRGVVERLDRLSSYRRDNPEVELALARGYLSLGDTLGYPRVMNLSDHDGAAASYAKAWEVLEPLLMEADGRTLAEAQTLQIRLLERDASLLLFRGQYEEALGPIADRLATLEAMCEARPDETAPSVERAAALESYGMTLSLLGRHAEAYDVMMAAIDAWTELSDADPGNFGYRFQLAQMISKAASLQRLSGDLEDAFALMEELLYRTDELHEERPSDLFVRSSKANNDTLFAILLRDMGRHEEAARYARQGVDAVEELHRADPGSTRFQRDLGIANYELGLSLQAGVDAGVAHPEAVDAFTRCVELMDPLAEADVLEESMYEPLEKARTWLAENVADDSGF